MTNIRILSRDKAEYQRLMKNIKAKIKRTQKNYGVDLTGEVDIRPLSTFKSRKEFNKWKEEMLSFTNRGNLDYQFEKNRYGVVASKRELFKAKEHTRKAQRIATDIQSKVRELPFISGGQVEGTVGQRMLQVKKPNAMGVYVPDDFEFDKYRSREYLEKRFKNLEKRADPNIFDVRTNQMLENFIEILELSFNSESDELIELLKDIPPQDFLEIYMQFDEFDFDLYDSDGQMVDADTGTINQMISNLEMYYRGEVNFDLRNI